MQVAAVPDMAAFGIPFPPPQPSTPKQTLPLHTTSIANESTQKAASAGPTKHALQGFMAAAV